MTARDHLQFLSGSEHRVRILDVLREPMRPCELEEAVTASRATIQRTLTGFEERGWVRKDGRRYGLTAGGRIVLKAYREFEATTETVDRAGEVLSLLGVDIPPAAIADATVILSSATRPHAAIEHYTGALSTAAPDRFLAISPVVSGLFNDAHEPLVESGIPIEVVIDERTLATAREATPEAMSLAAEADSVTLRVAPDDVTLGLAIMDGRVFVGAYDDQGHFRAVIDGTNDALTEWASQTFNAHRDRSYVLESLGSVESP